MHRVSLPSGAVDIHRAWTSAEVHEAVRAALDARRERLPAVGARVLIKPNLNNDLVALTGNSTDLRVLCALIEALQALGHREITVADGPNVGIERRGIDVFRRLRISGLRDRYGVRIVDLNREPGRRVPLGDGASPEVAAAVLDADFVISVPTVKTHAEVTLSCACKNWVGLAKGQDKRQLHYDIARNVARIAGLLPPDLVLVDGLVGMEGNGPGDGEPFRLGALVVADSPWLADLAVCRLVDLDWRDVPYLVHGHDDRRFDDADAQGLSAAVAALHTLKRAPQRSRLAIWSERRELLWLKKLVRPVVSRPRVTELAYQARIVQDVYSPEDDTIRGIRRDATACGDCRRCEDFCPTRLPLEQIGQIPAADACISCLYCWWACPKEAIALDGDPNAMERQIARYKPVIEKL